MGFTSSVANEQCYVTQGYPIYANLAEGLVLAILFVITERKMVHSWDIYVYQRRHGQVKF
jgi:hypothetical protein